MRRETIDEVQARNLFHGEGNGHLGFTDFTELEQALINSGYGYFVRRDNERIAKWDKRTRPHSLGLNHEDWIEVDFESYRYVREKMFFTEYHPATRTRSTYTDWKEFVINDREYYSIPAEDGGPVLND